MRKLTYSTLALLCVTFSANLFAADAPASGESVTATAKPYPLKTCIISGEELGSMGKPVVQVHKGQEVKFCCKSCIKKFDKNPDEYVKKALASKE
jgi:hypothetical protein